MQDQNNLNQNTSSVQQITDVPPMPDFLAPTPPTSPTTDPNYFPPNGNTTSNKKFGKGKIIATFLGILLLVAGIGTGIILVLQPQLLEQQAAVTNYCGASECDWGGFSCSQDGGTCSGTKGSCTCTYSGSGCFLPGTKIQTPTGDKNIESIVNGDNVYSFSQSANKINSSVVSNLHEVTRDYYYEISSFTNKVSVTAEHPFYIGGENYLIASKIRIGNIIYLLKDDKMVPSLVTSVIRINKPTRAYNLTVEGDHTFFANNYSVHNKSTPAMCATDLLWCSPTSNYSNGINCVRGGKFNSCCPSGSIGQNGTCVYSPVEDCSPSTAGSQSVCDPGYICSLTGKCAPFTGLGNCRNNTGNCFVDTAIGLVVNPDGSHGDICEAGGHWTTCAQGYSCSVNSAGFRDCIPQNVPNPTSPPSSNPPSNPPQPTPVPTPTRSPSPSPTPSPTPTRSPSPTPVPQCNSVCTTSLNCPSGMICSTGFCRNPSCTSQTNCLCPTPSPSPTPTRSPSPTPSPTPVPQCNSTCANNLQCPSGLVCSIATGATSGNCRNPSCTSQTNCLCPTATPSPIPSPTPGPTAICSSVKAYDTAWTLLSSTDLSNLRVGNNIQFCVAGTTTGESFDMARFTINGTLQANTTTKRPTSNDFCQAYTIPANVYTFEVTAEIHHTSLGWVGP